MSQLRHEILVGLHVSNEASYQAYRDGMTPLLHARGGSFRYDFRIAETLAGKPARPNKSINRLFLISFPDRATKDAFFAAPDYLAVRAAHFDGAVDSVEIIAEFDQTVG